MGSTLAGIALAGDPRRSERARCATSASRRSARSCCRACSAHGVGLVVERGALGSATFVALAVAVAARDVGAFLVGRRFGRTPLAPRLSPAKTRAGPIGSLLGAAVGVAAVRAGPDRRLRRRRSRSLLVPIVAIGAIWGDLFESAAKREAGREGRRPWLPGFGGILDRVDSLLITLPLAYWALRLADLAGKPT